MVAVRAGRAVQVVRASQACRAARARARASPVFGVFGVVVASVLACLALLRASGSAGLEGFLLGRRAALTPLVPLVVAPGVAWADGSDLRSIKELAAGSRKLDDALRPEWWPVQSCADLCTLCTSI